MPLDILQDRGTHQLQASAWGVQLKGQLRFSLLSLTSCPQTAVYTGGGGSPLLISIRHCGD